MKAPPMSWIDEIFHLTAWTRKRVAIRQQNQCALIGCLNQCELKKSFQNWVKKNWRGTDDNLALVHTLDIPNRVFGYRTAYCWCGSLALVDCGAVCNRLLSQTCLPPACLNESMCRLYVHVLQYHPIQEAEKTYCHQAQANPLETQWRCTRCFRKVFKHFPQCLSKTVTSHRPAVGTGRNGTERDLGAHDTLPVQSVHCPSFHRDRCDGKFGGCWKSQAAGLAPFHRSKGRGLPSESQRLNGQMDRRTIQFYLKWQKARDLEEHSEKFGVWVQN